MDKDLEVDWKQMSFWVSLFGGQFPLWYINRNIRKGDSVQKQN